MNEYGALCYKNSRNIGDIIQTIALMRLMGDKISNLYYRDSLEYYNQFSKNTLIVNGYLFREDDTDYIDSKCVPKFKCDMALSGVHGPHSRIINMLNMSNVQFPVGARDPITHDYCIQNSIPSILVGCYTLTLPKYNGERDGVYCVDFPVIIKNSIVIRHKIKEMPFLDEWALAIKLLNMYRTAKMVYTTRLHVVLPCLAFGTPVQYMKRGFGLDRFSILDLIGIRENRCSIMEVNPFQNNIIQHLSDITQSTIVDKNIDINDLTTPTINCPPEV